MNENSSLLEFTKYLQTCAPQKAHITPVMMTSRQTVYMYKLTILNFSEHQALISQVDLKTD